MNGLDVWVTSKIPVIKGQNSLDAMHSHRCGQPRIVNLNARHAILDKEAAPLCVDRQAVGEQPELFFEEFCSSVGILRGKTIAVAVERAGTCVPEFADIL